MQIRRLPTLANKLALIELGKDRLTDWERARLAEWSQLSHGSNKQNEIVDRMGEKLYGAENWRTFARGVDVR